MVFCMLFFIFMALLLILALVRNSFTFRAQQTIAMAMHAYNMNKIMNNEYDGLLNYDDIEPYEKTFFRIWDWGYERLLPQDQFELIRRYLPVE